MAAFQYQARTMRGDRVSGRLEAATEAAVDDLLRTRGLYVVRIRPDAAAAAQPRPTTTVRLNRRDLAVFTMHLATVLRSGLPLSLGLRSSIDEGYNERVRAVALALLERVERGELLSEAMAALPRAFPDHYVNLVKAGETVGHVDEVLFDLLRSIEWQMNLRSEIRQASIYPSILLVLACSVVIGIATIVLPRFVDALSRAGIPPTASAARVIAVGAFVQTYWLQVVLGLVMAAAATALAADSARGHYWLDYVKLRIPLFGTLLRQAALSRFTHHLSMMIRAGVNFVVALNVVEHVVGNRVIAASIARARERVIAGSSLADALKVSGQFTPFVLQMVATGEATGSIEDTLKKVTEYYDREVPATVKRITTAMEPLVYVILGVVVIAVALALYAPLASLMQQIPTRPRGF